jgi:omega-amidase
VWNSPYATSAFPANAEPVPEVGAAVGDVAAEASPSLVLVLRSAREHGVFLIGGSIPEIGADGNIYNTCVVADPAGTIVAKHRKMHLFDIDIPGRQSFRESDTLTGGSAVTTFAMPQCVVGVGICYDLRFPEQAHLMRQAGAKLLVYPGAFNTTTGPMHWELLQRARAVDNQLWVAAASPARNPESEYQAWGHSSIVSPLGEVVATCDEVEKTVVFELDIAAADEFRTNVPT